MQHTATNHRLRRREPATIDAAKPMSFAFMQTDILAGIGLFLFSLILNIIGINWALPSAERSQFYPTDPTYYESVGAEVDRLYTTAPYHTYNPDEVYVLDALTNMSPSELDFNPRFFNYPSFMIYATGAAVKAADIAGWLTLANSKDYYLTAPGDMGQIFIVGRLLTALISSIGVASVYYLVRFLYQRQQLAVLSAIVLATMPLWVRNSHFLLVNIPSAAWMVLSAAFAAWAIHSQRVRPILISAFIAGVATSTKYTSAAVLALPVFSVAQIIIAQRRAPNRQHPSFLNQARFGSLFSLAGIGLAFFIGFVLITPYALITPAKFLNDVLYEGGTKLGAPPASLVISDFIWAQGTVLLILSLIGVAIALRQLRTWQSQFLLIFVFAGLGQRLISDVAFTRYIIPALPAMAIFAAMAIDAIRNFAQAKSNQFVGWSIAILLLLPGLSYSAETLSFFANGDVRTTTAAWLDQNLPDNAEVGYWYQMWFDNTPLHIDRFELVNLDERQLSDYPPVAVYPSLTTSYFDLPRPPAEYELITFEQRPNQLWTWPLDVSAEPLDWAYTYLDIKVYIHPETSGLDVDALRAAIESN